MIPKKLGWVLLAAPLIAWLAWATPAWLAVGKAEREHRQLLRIYELETVLKSPQVFVADDGERYHRQTHLPEKTEPLSHFLAQERGYTPCLTCKPAGRRAYPKQPEADPTIASRRGAIRWSIGLIPLTWIALWLLPIPFREYYMKWPG